MPLVKRILRFLLGLVAALLVLAGVAVGLGAYFLYTPEPEPPALSGTISKGSIEAGGLTRTYRLYLPKDLPKGAPLVVVLHGASENGGAIRVETGYAFERLADKQGFAVVYPDGFDGWWNGCAASDDSEANHRDIDDVGFLAALADKLVAEDGIDPARLFATGVSNGGDMAIRLALAAPARWRAVAPVAANLRIPGESKCKPPARGRTSVLLVHGTADRLEPFAGGEGSLFGFFKSGKILSTRDTAGYFAELNGIAGNPAVTAGKTSDGFSTERLDWGAGSPAEVELFAIEGAGHVFPQPYYTARRLLGPSPKDPDGAELIWSFFARQK
jgi:polyhydroxybutyrate depolymerase